jgi:hypothetical protein
MHSAFGVFERERGFMAYLVLALGAFLSIGGALSIFHGAGIVEVERGWTGVIAGATALTGGIVTIALGLILRTLLDLRPLLAGQRAVTALPADVKVEHDFDAHGSHEPLPAAQASEPMHLMTAEFENGMLAAILAPAEPVAAERPVGAPAEHPKAATLPVANAFEDPKQVVEAPPHPPAVSERHAEVAAAETPSLHPEPDSERSRFKIGFRRQPPAPLPPEPVPVPVAEPEAPPMDDWLDRAFSAFDNEGPLGAPRAARHPHEETNTAVDAPLAHAEPHAEAAPEPPHAEPPPEPASAPAPTSAVIGRYEADGTSYVMYADGSIEAQSDAGVYRFNSMTELKAFIESTET